MSKSSSVQKSGPRKTKGKPNSMDEHVGARLRLRRGLIGLSQEKLAEAIGLTFQQIQKYERGTNRISAGRLHDLSRILDVPVSYFFDSFAGGAAQALPAAVFRTQSRMASPRPSTKPCSITAKAWICSSFIIQFPMQNSGGKSSVLSAH